MELSNTKKEIISRLQQEILVLEGFKPLTKGSGSRFGLGKIENAFPNSVFPTAAIHEFINTEPEHAAACSGFLAGILNTLMSQGGTCLWIGTSRRLFPPSLSMFNIPPDRIIFIDAKEEKEVLWVMEQALKCEGLAAVIAEVREISIVQSRRLQLAVESSKGTGFILRNDPRKLGANTCVARWKISPLPSEPEDELPGVGFPRWQVDLLRVRNGNPGSWKLEWAVDQFILIEEKTAPEIIERRISGNYA